jgi:hypothetical protein
MRSEDGERRTVGKLLRIVGVLNADPSVIRTIDAEPTHEPDGHVPAEAVGCGREIERGVPLVFASQGESDVQAGYAGRAPSDGVGVPLYPDVAGRRS